VGTRPDEVKAEIEATRAQLEKDLDQLNDKISPGKVAARTAHDARVAAGRTASSMRERVGQNPAVESVRRKAHEQVDHTAATVRGQMDAHPRVATSTQKAMESTQRAGLAVRRQAERSPRASAGVVGVVIVALVTLVVVRRHGRQPSQGHSWWPGSRLVPGSVGTAVPGGRLPVETRHGEDG
jgi:hypothetical protein